MNSNDNSLTTNSWLIESTKILTGNGIASSRLDCLVLLEDTLQKDRSWLLAHPEHVIDKQALKKLNGYLVRRISHEPIAYIRGKTEFYGREFIVSQYTLEPRPETETMIDLIAHTLKPNQTTATSDNLAINNKPNCLIIDVGTGSGCIGISLKLLVPCASVVGTDISSKCLDVASSNALNLNAKIKLFKGDLIKPINNSPLLSRYKNLIIAANLPYVPDDHTINKAALKEPKLAIFGGKDGLDLYRRLFSQIVKFNLHPSHIFTESLPFQHSKLESIANEHNFKLIKTDDFIQQFSS